MLLLIDIGNTRIKWAAVEGNALGKWHAAGALPHAQLPELLDAWQRMPLSRALISNVAGNEVRAVLQQGLAIPVEWFASLPEAAGIRNHYREPAQLGCDRFAAAIGAHALFPGRDLLIVNCGTATTIDAISADGAFNGGMILPGLRLMAISLAHHTAQLPLAAEDGMPPLFADNTGDAIRSGCLSAQAGAIEHAFAAQAQSQPALHCVLSGGAADAVAARLSISHEQVENLALIGLHAYASSRMPGHAL